MVSRLLGPITITDELPAGLAPASGASGFDELASKQDAAGANFSHDCGPTGSGFLSCTYSGVVQPDDTLVLSFPVTVASTEELKKQEEERETKGLPPTMCPLTAAAVGCALNVVRVSGGGALAAAMQTPTQIDSEPATFGISRGRREHRALERAGGRAPRSECLARVQHGLTRWRHGGQLQEHHV